MQVSSICVVGNSCDSLLDSGRIRGPEPSSFSPEPDAAFERSRQRTSKLTTPPELCAPTPAHSSEDWLRQKTPPGPLQLSWDEDWSREAQYGKVQKRLASPRQVDFSAMALHI